MKIFIEAKETEAKQVPECTGYIISDDPEALSPAHCPKCKGFIKWVEKEGEGLQPICNKCHAPLVLIPDPDSEEDYEWGKICVLKPLTDVAEKSVSS